MFIPVTGQTRGESAGSDNEWVQITHPYLKQKTPSEIAATYKPQDKPWWQVTEQHLLAFADILDRVHRDNIEQRIWEQYPILAREVSAQYGSVEKFISVALEDADYCGFNTTEHKYKFLMLCLHYDFNTSPAEGVRSILAQARQAPDRALEQVEKNLRSPQHVRY